MKYTGRIITIVFGIFSYLVMWSITRQPLNYFHIIALVFFCLIGWFLGKQYDKAKFYSEKDELTNVYNRRFVLLISPKLLAIAKRNNEKLGVSVVDVDNFKLINDTYGHEIGDKVLQGISNSLVKATRETDTVARWGGDEILILSPSMDIKCPKIIANRIEDEIKELSKHLDLDISVSIGTSLYPDDGKSIDELVREADKNMYKFKFSKKNCSISTNIETT